MTEESAIKTYYALCLRTDVPAAIRSLRKSKKSHREKLFAKRVQSRFVSKTECPRISTTDPFVREVILAYRTYYRDSLLTIHDLKRHEARHETQLHSIAKNFDLRIGKNTDWGRLESAIQREINRRGYHCLLGRVSPLRSLLIWNKQNSKKFRVKLVGGTQKLPVVFLHGFIELGWLHYAAFGKYYVGGWAKMNALYCVAQAYKYKFNSDAFRASYLAHEAQHYADYTTFPKLNQANLEYRAKLAELVSLSRPSRRLEFFRSEAKNDSTKPHCLASYRLIKHFDLGKIQQAKSISEIAAQLLRDHTAALMKAGAKTASNGLKP